MSDARHIFERLETSLRERHPSLQVTDNPVLRRFNRKEFDISEAEKVLAQYCFLPATIVEYLSWGISRSGHLPSVYQELQRNRSEELGSRTASVSHYSILRRALMHEFALALDVIPPADETLQFLNAIRDGLVRYSPGHAVGVVYALEDSAVPELSVVAKVTNEFAALNGREPPITYPVTSERSADWRNKSAGDYSLNDFFAMHLLDFEIGHQSRLERAVCEYLGTSIPTVDFEQGFEETLRHMDDWWFRLASVDWHSYPAATPRPDGVSK